MKKLLAEIILIMATMYTMADFSTLHQLLRLFRIPWVCSKVKVLKRNCCKKVYLEAIFEKAAVVIFHFLQFGAPWTSIIFSGWCMKLQIPVTSHWRFITFLAILCNQSVSATRLPTMHQNLVPNRETASNAQLSLHTMYRSGHKNNASVGYS